MNNQDVINEMMFAESNIINTTDDATSYNNDIRSKHDMLIDKNHSPGDSSVADSPYKHTMPKIKINDRTLIQTPN
jgi:hypothetical protein